MPPGTRTTPGGGPAAPVVAMLLGNDKRTSRIAVIAVALFLLFDLTALALNVWLSRRIERQAVAINLAGRQRMLTQRMVKALLELEDAQHAGQPLEGSLRELRLTFQLFDDTLLGFDHGHLTRGGEDEALFLPPVTGDNARRLVTEAVVLWRPYRAHVAAVLESPPEALAQTLPAAVASAREGNQPLLRLMNALTTHLERLTHQEAGQIRFFQGSAFLLALLNFFWALELYRRRIRQFNRSHSLLDDVINKVSASVLVLDEAGVVRKANLTAEKMFAAGAGGLVGLRADELVRDEPPKQVGRRRDGATFIAQAQRSEVTLAEQRLFILTVLDVTQQRMTEEHLSTLAYHDLLTHLPNRLLFDDRLRLELAHARRRGHTLAVLFIDLDRFKPVNDQYGHEMGDLLLQDVAIRLKRCLRDSDTVSRRGGDEFTVIATDLGKRQAAEHIAEMILLQLGRPFSVAGQELHIGASIGVALFPDDGDEGHLLLSRADEAMYQAKQAGRGTWRCYSPPDGQDAPPGARRA